MSFDFDKPINRRDTGSIKWGIPEDYIPMSIADMDFAVSPAITERIINRAKHPVYGYTRPDKVLFEVFRSWILQTYDFEIKDSWLELIPGIVPALAVASNVVPGKSITNTPNYSNLLNAPERAGNTMVTVPLKNTDEHYEIDFDDLERNLTPDTKIFYLCNPHNPVGKIYTREELQQVNAFAKKHELIVVSDEIHCELVFDKKHIPFFTVDDYAREHSITFMAPGKTYNIPGVVLAFAIIPNEELREKFRAAGYAMGHPGIFNIEAAIAAYGESEEWKKELVEYLRENRNYLESELKKRFPKAKFPHTEGTYLQWIDFRPYGEEINADFLKKYAKVIVTDGKGFGEDGYVRLNFGCRRETLKEALDRIETAIKDRNN